MMRIGVSPFASTREAVLRLAELAVAGGLDTLWLGDGYVAGDDFPGWAGGMESMTELAWLAGRFPSARIGISAAILPLRDPRWLAKQANTLDNITDGRFVLAVAAGFWERDFDHRGVSYDARGQRFDAYLAALLAALGGEPFEGPPGDDRIDIPAGRLAPAPGDGRIVPVWLAGAEATMRRALRAGLPFQSSRATPEELAPIARRWFDAGGGLLGHRVRLQIDRRAEGRELDWHAVTGTVDELVDALGRFAALGVGDLSIVPGQDDATSLETVTALVEEVLPQLGG
jgi:alkanesulfonate monooxygenase SsuD/methylene tetrahydromethanopterin reductase-like flavin-dependent oxidoreductase (luciferase family)